MWIVWNEGRTEAFVTHDEQLAYEVRKSADTNCVYESGYPAPVAVAFCNKWADDACEMFPYDPDELAAMRARLETQRIEMNRAYERHNAELATMRAQLASRDAALDEVLAFSNYGDVEQLKALLATKHGVHPK